MEKLGAKRRRAAVDVDDSWEDRISKLPEPILHHILCFLPQRAAAKTCVLSKAWRYLWCTRPKLDFRYGCTLVESFFSVLDRTLRSYLDRKLHLPELTLHLSPSHDQTDSFLENWLWRILAQSLGVIQFHLHFPSHAFKFPRKKIPFSIFDSESLLNLSLKNCKLESISAAAPPPLKHLRKLTLDNVIVPEEILDHILSNCRFVEYLTITRCKGFEIIQLKHPPNLKEFCIHDHAEGATSLSMGHKDIPTLRTVVIHDCLLSLPGNHQLHFSHLTRLMMRNVRLLSSDDVFSCTLPCLEELRLYLCSGIKHFKLSSSSMKRMDIINMNNPFKVTLDVPSILSFRYQGILPQSISFSATCDRDWKSYIDLTCFLDESSLCLNDLIGLLKALSQSEISIELNRKTVIWLRNQLRNINVGADLPVAVDHLIVQRSSFGGDLLNNLFLMLRPRFIYTNNISKPLAKTRQEIILEQREMSPDFLQRFSKGVSMQVFYQHEGKWQPFQPIILSKLVSKRGECMDQIFLPIDMERKIKLIIFN